MNSNLRIHICLLMKSNTIKTMDDIDELTWAYNFSDVLFFSYDNRIRLVLSTPPLALGAFIDWFQARLDFNHVDMRIDKAELRHSQGNYLGQQFLSEQELKSLNQYISRKNQADAPVPF